MTPPLSAVTGRPLNRRRTEGRLTVWGEGGVVHARPRRTSGVSSSTEPVPLLRAHVAPAAHAALKVTVLSERTVSVRQQHVVESHVALQRGTGLHSLNHNLECKACGGAGLSVAAAR